MVFERPSFLKPNIDANKDPREEAGTLHIVAGRVGIVELSAVPMELAERVSEGKVLKRYKYEEWSYSWPDEFRGEKDFDYSLRNQDSEMQWVLDAARKYTRIADVDDKPEETKEKIYQELEKANPPISRDFAMGVLEKYSLASMARKLKARYQEITQQFQGTLPDLMVPTEYVVGSDDKSPDPTGKPQNHIYELQPKVQGLMLPVNNIEMLLTEAGFARSPSDRQAYRMMMGRYTRKAKEHIQDRYPTEMGEFKRELLEFVSTARKIPVQSKLIPFDIVYPQNVLFTKDGLRVVDCNGAFRIPERESSESRILQRSCHTTYRTLLEMWEMLAREL